MNHTSLYRKYRPRTFEDVVEQTHIVKILTGQIKNDSVAHAYLFTGTRGTGKTSLARIFAKAINCEHPINGSPCLECSSCKQLDGVNSDIYELDAASNNGVDDVRALKESVQYRPLIAKKKVYIIDEVHQFSQSAFNALLKTLEEPPEYCVFILATTEPQKLPQTILSRCLKLDFRLISQDGLSKHIAKIFDKEGVEYNKEACDLIASAGEGSVRDSLSVAEACIGTAQFLDYNAVLEILGASSPDFIHNICNSMLGGDIAACLASIEYSCSKGKSIAVLAKDITKYLRNLLIVKSVEDVKFLNLPDSVVEGQKKLAERFSSSQILRALEIFSGLDSLMRYATTPRYVLETAIAKVVEISENSIIATKAKVEELERRINEGATVTKYVKEVGNPYAVTQPEIPNTTQEYSPIQNESANNTANEVKKEELPFDSTLPEEISRAEEKPNQRAILRAKSIRVRAYLSSKCKAEKPMLYTIISDESSTLIFVNNGYTDIVVQDSFSCKLLESHKDYLSKLLAECLQEECKLNIKLTDNKSSKESSDTFKSSFDPSKVKVIK